MTFAHRSWAWPAGTPSSAAEPDMDSDASPSGSMNAHFEVSSEAVLNSSDCMNVGQAPVVNVLSVPFEALPDGSTERTR